VVPNAADAANIPDAIPRAEPRSASGNPPFYDVAGHRYVVLPTAVGYVERGVASWYGTEFHGLRTSTGERYDMFAMTAAHKTLPLPCYARITNLSNGRSVVVRINDRGPFVANRIIDLSYTAAAKLDMIRNGTAFVEVEALTPATAPLNAELPVAVAPAAAASVGVSTVPAISVAPTVSAPTSTPPASASVAAPALAPGAAALPTPAALNASHFSIQIGAYAQNENAQRVMRRLRAAGLERIYTLNPAPGEPLLRVRIGPIQSVQEFDALIERLNALGFTGARLAQD
jgi:rare lipoprotein A